MCERTDHLSLGMLADLCGGESTLAWFYFLFRRCSVKDLLRIRSEVPPHPSVCACSAQLESLCNRVARYWGLCEWKVGGGWWVGYPPHDVMWCCSSSSVSSTCLFALPQCSHSSRVGTKKWVRINSGFGRGTGIQIQSGLQFRSEHTEKHKSVCPNTNVWMHLFSLMVWLDHGDMHACGPHLAAASSRPVKGLFGEVVSTQDRKLADVVAKQQD